MKLMDVIGKIRGVCGGYVVETKGDVEKGTYTLALSFVR